MTIPRPRPSAPLPHWPPNSPPSPVRNRARAQPCISGPRHNRWEAVKFPSTNAHSASSYQHSSSDTTVLIRMADSNKRKAGNDAAGGAAFKKKKVSHWVDWSPRPRLDTLPQHDCRGEFRCALTNQPNYFHRKATMASGKCRGQMHQTGLRPILSSRATWASG